MDLFGILVNVKDNILNFIMIILNFIFQNRDVFGGICSSYIVK